MEITKKKEKQHLQAEKDWCQIGNREKTMCVMN